MRRQRFPAKPCLLGRSGTFTLSRTHAFLVLYQLAANDFSVVGVAYGRPGSEPDHLIVCPDPLDRADVADRLRPMRDDMAAWLSSHVITSTQHPKGYERYQVASAPQLFVAGGGVVTSLDNLAYGWRYTQGLDPGWAVIGEELAVLCEFRRRPGQAIVIPLAEALAEHFALGISPVEAAKLSVNVALCSAGPTGLTTAEVRAAETFESGPLGRPDQLDEPVWAALARDRHTPSGAVEPILSSTWDRCNEAWQILSGIREAPSAAVAADRAALSWARRVGPVRSGSQYRRRRATPNLATAARELVELEVEAAEHAAAAVLEDPLLAAEAAAGGKAARLDARVTARKVGRSTRIHIVGTCHQLLPLRVGDLVGLAGTSARARVTNVVRVAAASWRVELYIGGDDKQTSGIRQAQRLPDGPRWVAVVPRPGPPAMSAPPQAPVTHPNARGGSSAAAPGGDQDA